MLARTPATLVRLAEQLKRRLSITRCSASAVPYASVLQVHVSLGIHKELPRVRDDMKSCPDASTSCASSVDLVALLVTVNQINDRQMVLCIMIIIIMMMNPV